MLLVVDLKQSEKLLKEIIKNKDTNSYMDFVNIDENTDELTKDKHLLEFDLMCKFGEMNQENCFAYMSYAIKKMMLLASKHNINIPKELLIC